MKWVGLWTQAPSKPLGDVSVSFVGCGIVVDVGRIVRSIAVASSKVVGSG